MAGRPKMTEAQKEAAKKAREDAKTGAAGKADKAEARANGGKAAAAAAPKPQTTANTDDLDREEKALFLHHMPLIKAGRERVATATADLRNLYKRAKGEANFTKADFDTAFALETAEKEARERAKIARALKIARIVGSSMGNQLDLFLEPDRTPAADRAREEGERASMEGKSAVAPYDPSTEQHRMWLEGWHAHQAVRSAGFKPLSPAVAEDVADTAAQKAKTGQQKAQDAATFEQADKPNGETVETPAPASSVAMTRAQFKAAQEAAKGAGKPN